MTSPTGDAEFDAARLDALLNTVNNPEIVLPLPILSEQASPNLSGVTTYQEQGVTALLVPPADEDEGPGTPTRGKKMVAIRPAAGFALNEFRNAVVAAYHQFILDGVITVEELAAKSGLSLVRAGELLATVEFRRACEIRGLRLDKTNGLTQEQDLCLLVVLDPYDSLTMSQKLKKAGVSNAKFQAWMRNPLFKNQVDRVSERLLDNNSTGLVQLERLVGEGDLKAIAFKFEMNNRYNPRREAVIDILSILNSVMETLAKHVRDPEVLMAVATELKEIAETAAGSKPKEITQ